MADDVMSGAFAVVNCTEPRNQGEPVDVSGVGWRPKEYLVLGTADPRFSDFAARVDREFCELFGPNRMTIGHGRWRTALATILISEDVGENEEIRRQVDDNDR